ncbi:hypothetical protein TrST_g2165 [Triparma strigata]|uniref:Uncharacterized protein n=1 Tax=Triparma strigata TaxID=1606541 RepID=A0A9W7ETQ7_9STRA|nr:hypothetical protein TrST_g2165 [Triparma strigata]
MRTAVTSRASFPIPSPNTSPPSKDELTNKNPSKKILFKAANEFIKSTATAQFSPKITSLPASFLSSPPSSPSKNSSHVRLGSISSVPGLCRDEGGSDDTEKEAGDGLLLFRRSPSTPPPQKQQKTTTTKTTTTTTTTTHLTTTTLTTCPPPGVTGPLPPCPPSLPPPLPTPKQAFQMFSSQFDWNSPSSPGFKPFKFFYEEQREVKRSIKGEMEREERGTGFSGLLGTESLGLGSSSFFSANQEKIVPIYEGDENITSPMSPVAHNFLNPSSSNIFGSDPQSQTPINPDRPSTRRNTTGGRKKLSATTSTTSRTPTRGPSSSHTTQNLLNTTPSFASLLPATTKYDAIALVVDVSYKDASEASEDNEILKYANILSPSFAQPEDNQTTSPRISGCRCVVYTDAGDRCDPSLDENIVLPPFESLVNFNRFIVKKRARGDVGITRRCVMCGTQCYIANPETGAKRKNAGKEVADDPSALYAALRKNSRLIANCPASIGNGTREDASDLPLGAVIPNQNKGLCSLCDRAVWLFSDTPNNRIPIKWCKGCKNFRPWALFRDKGRATKCSRCRGRQRGTVKPEKNKINLGQKKDPNRSQFR